MSNLLLMYLNLPTKYENPIMYIIKNIKKLRNDERNIFAMLLLFECIGKIK